MTSQEHEAKLNSPEPLFAPRASRHMATNEIARLETSVGELQASLKRLRAARRVGPILFVLGLVLFIAFAAIVLDIAIPRYFGTEEIAKLVTQLGRHPFFTTTLAAYLILSVILFTRLILSETSVEADIDLLHEKKRIASTLPTETKFRDEGDNAAPSYFDSLVKINIDNLAEYYSLVKVHTNNSFRSSLLTAFVGFAFILIGVIAGFGGGQAATPARLAVISGISIEFLAGIFFYLYNRTVRQLKEYHDSLLSVQNVLLSLKLVNDTQDAEAKLDMIARTCEVLLAGDNLASTRKSKTSKASPRKQEAVAGRASKLDVSQ